jgi:hypothetical protein
MSDYTFHRILQRTCSNGPMTNAQMQDEIDMGKLFFPVFFYSCHL